MNHYPHHVGDYATGTQGFTQGDHGAYRLLMDAYYAAETALLAEDVYTIGKATTPAERKCVDKVLARKFTLKDGRYFHARIEAELEAFRSRSKDASAKANIRWDKERAKKGAKGNATAYADASIQHDPLHDPGSAATMLASSHKPVENQQPGKAQLSGVGNIPADPAPLAALAAVCVRSRVNADGAKGLMHLRQFAAEGVTEQILADAVLVARDRKPDPEIIPVAYLAPIIVDLRAGRVRARPLSQDDAIAQAIANVNAKESANAAH